MPILCIKEVFVVYYNVTFTVIRNQLFGQPVTKNQSKEV